MLSSSSAPPEMTSARCVSVRFEDACVLIPPSCRVPSKSPLRPRIITKSYSLPLWKSLSPKKVDSQSLASQEPNEIVNPETERKAFSLTVSVPSLTTKSRPRRPSLPLPSPCLSRRNLGFPQSPDSKTPPASPLSPLGAASTPMVSPSVTHRTHSFPGIQPAALKEVETVPLRPCCETCHSCVDAALAEGEKWSERWSSGAMRRYTEGEHVHLHAPCPSVFDVTRAWTTKSVFDVTRAWTTKSVCDDADGDIPLKDALTIDEIDVKRRSDDYSRALLNHHIPPPATQEVVQDAESDDEAVTQEVTAVEPVAPRILTALLQEEGEDMLFPLPSPRCTPNQSPSLTPTGSQVHLPAIPSGSQTNLVVPAASSPLAPVIKTPAPRARSPTTMRPPLSTPVPSTETAPDPSPPRSMSSSPVHRRQQRSSSPRRAQPRRSSFSTASETLLKGSAAILKGVATGITGSGML